MEYKKTQFGWVMVIGLFIIFCLVFITGIIKGSEASFIVFPLIILSGCAALFHSLTIEVTETYLRFYFGFGIISKTIMLEDIIKAEPIKSAFVMGWGIRISWGYTLYNVSGMEAVELDFKDRKRKIRIGTNEPDEVARIINKNLKQLNSINS